jgi:HK97 family phage major capsid protein
MTEHVSPEDLAKQISAEVKTTYEAIDKKTADLGEVIAEIKKAVGAKADTTDLENWRKGLDSEVKKLAAQADDLDKKLSRPNGGASEGKSLGQQVAESDGFKSFVSNGGGRFKFETKTVLTTDLAVGSQTLTPGVPRAQAGLVRMPDQGLTIRDLLPVGRTTSNAIEYPRETAFTNNAAVVAEGATKPESTFDMTLETAPVRTIAHYFRVSKQIMDDMAMLQGYIDGRLRYGLAIEEEGETLNGDGTGQHLNGILAQASDFPASVATSGIPGGTGATAVDVIRWAKLQVRQSLYPATGVVLNPEDWASIELLKDANDAYLYSAFASGTEPRLWGMRVVESDAIAAGTFLVGSFAMGAQIWDREQANVVISTEDQDNIVKNLITIRGEERLALTVYRPAAFVTGSFTLAS